MDSIYEKLDGWIKSNDYKTSVKCEKEILPLHINFLNKFNLNYLKSMQIDDYVEGNNNKETFCYMVEKTLKVVGALSGRTTAFQKFVIYWDKAKKDYVFGDKRTKKRPAFGDNKNDIYNNVRNSIIAVVVAAQQNDYDKISASKLNPQFRNKIAYLYSRENQIPIYSDGDLNVILAVLEIPFDKQETVESKRRKLFDFYTDIVKTNYPNLSTFLFMRFIYSAWGYRNILRSDDKPTVDTKEIVDYELVDIQIDEVFKTKRTGKGTSKRIIYNPGSEEGKRITGRKAEDIVVEYLKKHQKELNIKKIFTWCFGEEQDDGKGYDISYIQNDGKEVFVEVKATKADLKNQVYFEMSANELSVMSANKNNYYVYFVNNVNKGKIIKRITGNYILGNEEPIKYRINFKSKNK